MKLAKIASLFLVLIILSYLLSVDFAYAYLDPGVGGIWLQTTVAAIAGGFLFLRSYWQTFLNLIGSDSGPAMTNDRDQTDLEETKHKA
jgi:hypothetical protein